MIMLLDLLMISGVTYTLYMFNQYVAAAFAIFIIHGIIKHQYATAQQVKLYKQLFGKKDDSDNSKE